MYISLLLLFYLYKHFIQANKAFDSKELSQSVAFFSPGHYPFPLQQRELVRRVDCSQGLSVLLELFIRELIIISVMTI